MNKTIIITAVLLLAGCATNPFAPKAENVIPMAGGIYSVSAVGKTEEKAMKPALFSAAETCKERQMRHVVTSKNMTYKGMVQEDTNRTINKVAEYIPFMPTLSNKDDYQVTLLFTCEA